MTLSHGIPLGRGQPGSHRLVLVWTSQLTLRHPDLLENAKDTLCRNVTIYGRCRYEDKGAALSLTIVSHDILAGIRLTVYCL